MNCLTCGRPTSEHVGFKCPDISESRFIDLLATLKGEIESCFSDWEGDFLVELELGDVD